DFHRPNSATSVGTSPLGGTPTATTLTFGITSRQLYVASGSAVGYLTWACNTGNVDIELEFLSPSGVYNIGIVSRFINSSNYYYVNFHAQTITLQSKVSGTTTSLGSVSGGPPSGLQNLFRIGLRVRESSL